MKKAAIQPAEAPTTEAGASLDEINLSDQRAAMSRLFEERTRIGMSLWEMEAQSGVSWNSAYAWRRMRREPTLGNLVALASVLGFDVVLRKQRPAAGKPKP